MKALTLNDPWAQFVARGYKTIETRSWSTSYRGPLAIHSSKRFGQLFRAVRDKLWPEIGEWTEWPRGAIVASCTLVDVVPILGDRFDGTYPEDGRYVILDQPPSASHPYVHAYWKRSDDGLRRSQYFDEASYGDFAPGRFAWLLEDIKPAEERCPACWGEGGFDSGETADHLQGPPHHIYGCQSCAGVGRCHPIPAKGKPRLWEWEPAI